VGEPIYSYTQNKAPCARPSSIILVDSPYGTVAFVRLRLEVIHRSAAPEAAAPTK